MLGTVAEFLGRRTDFFSGGKEGQWQSVWIIMTIYFSFFLLFYWKNLLFALEIILNLFEFRISRFVPLFLFVQMLREIFVKADREHREQKKKLAEKEAGEVTKRMEAKQRREEELKKKSSAIYEVTEDEAVKLQKEIDAEKYVLFWDFQSTSFTAAIEKTLFFYLIWFYIRRNKKNDDQSETEVSKPLSEETEVSKPLGDKTDDDSEQSELKQNKGYGCNLEHYKWTQTKEEVEVSSQ